MDALNKYAPLPLAVGLAMSAISVFKNKPALVLDSKLSLKNEPWEDCNASLIPYLVFAIRINQQLPYQRRPTATKINSAN